MSKILLIFSIIFGILLYLIFSIIIFVTIFIPDRLFFIPGYISSRPLVVFYTFGIGSEIYPIVPPQIDKIWWDSNVVVTLNHPISNLNRVPNPSSDDLDFSTTHYYVLYPEEDVVLRFENKADLDNSLRRLGIDPNQVQLEGLSDARKKIEKQQELAGFKITGPYTYANNYQLGWHLSKIYKNRKDIDIGYTNEISTIPHIDFVTVPSGEMKRKDILQKRMGTYWADYTVADTGGLATISIDKDFLLSKYEITQAQYAAVMGYNPASDHGMGDNYPVYNVSWIDAIEFCRRLTERARALGTISTNQQYTLPTGEQWMYACHAGQGGADLYTGYIPLENIFQAPCMDEAGWYWYNQGSITYGCNEVGLKKPNDWGFYDMLGNVSEWCMDIKKASGSKARGTEFYEYVEAGNFRATRGGSWHHSAYQCRTAVTHFRDKNARSPTIGFRVALIEH